MYAVVAAVNNTLDAQQLNNKREPRRGPTRSAGNPLPRAHPPIDTRWLSILAAIEYVLAYPPQITGIAVALSRMLHWRARCSARLKKVPSGSRSTPLGLSSRNSFAKSSGHRSDLRNPTRNSISRMPGIFGEPRCLLRNCRPVIGTGDGNKAERRSPLSGRIGEMPRFDLAGTANAQPAEAAVDEAADGDDDEAHDRPPDLRLLEEAEEADPLALEFHAELEEMPQKASSRASPQATDAAEKLGRALDLGALLGGILCVIARASGPNGERISATTRRWRSRSLRSPLKTRSDRDLARNSLARPDRARTDRALRRTYQHSDS